MATFLIIILSIVLGLSMKMADLLDEHGLKWFKGSAILFGCIWGISGALLLFGPNALTMFWLATFLTYLIKAQIDYINHGIAETIIILTFFRFREKLPIDWTVFLYFFLTIGLTGLFNKYVIENNVIKNMDWIKKIFKLRIHYNSIAFLFSIFTGIWIVFISRMLFWISYETITHYGARLVEKYK